MPVVYAYVQIEGAYGQITDENGALSIGAGKAKAYSVNVRRIGYEPWFGKLEFPDTAATLTVVLKRIGQALAEVRVTERANTPVFLRPFYDRWMMRQKGLLSAVFIGPEEIEFRHPDRTSNMLSGLNGVTLRRGAGRQQYPLSMNGTCPIPVLVDGVQKQATICLGICLGPPGGGNAGSSLTQKGIWVTDINDVVEAGDVAAIEVYSRGGNMPSSLHVNDSACGAIVIWTGSRKP